ncbi:hypothetical protein GQ457_18G011820 [Hibiscus cannabinus]
MNYPTDRKVKATVSLQRGEALNWWESISNIVFAGRVTWEFFWILFGIVTILGNDVVIADRRVASVYLVESSTLIEDSMSECILPCCRSFHIVPGRVTNPGGWMTPSPLDRKTKANEAEPRWRDRLVLTRLFYHSGIPNGATGGDAEATRVGLVRYDIKRPHAVRLTHQMVKDLLRSSATKVVYMNRRSGALFTALYLKQCAVTLQQAYGGITPYHIHTKLSVPVSLTRSGYPRIIPSFGS